jgi:hypothetical protein
MDIYLAAAADGLSSAATARNDGAMPRGEDAYYARYASGPTLPSWVGRLCAAIRHAYPAAAERARVTRHA